MGNIDIKGISFHYPSREKHVFDDMSLVIPAG
jgi:ABC-type bacteriocin/lantibiotic exporter with double-glycine peptidase domain